MLAIPWQHFLEPGSDRLVLIGIPQDERGNSLPVESLTGDTPAELEVVSVAAVERYSRRPASSRLTTGYLFLDASSLALDVARKHTARQDLEQTLGDACRLFPHQLLVQLQKLPADWSPDPLFAFGFRQIDSASASTVFEFRLSDYKAPPAWLNARYWANPERYEQVVEPDEFSDLTGSFDDTADETIDEEWE